MKPRIQTIRMSDTKTNLLPSMALLMTLAITSSLLHTTSAEGPLFECPKGKKKETINFLTMSFYCIGGKVIIRN